METFREISPYDWEVNVFSAIQKEWMLLAAGNGERTNMMTASWGGLGVLWNKPVAMVFVRPQRYTKELMDGSDGFSCCFFAPEYKEQLGLCGSQSGRDVNKVEACGFDVLTREDIPYFAQAKAAVLCRKLYRQPLEQGCFFSQDIPREHYAQNDYHELYIGEITDVLLK